MSFSEEEANLITFQCFLERLGSNSKTLIDKVNNNRVVQEIAIEGL
jgi:hypothetical protein